jgi:hypothetical protein
MTAASIFRYAADLTHGIVLAEHLNYLPRVFDRVCKMLVAFFRMSFSNVKRPTKRSNSAIRLVSWLLDGSRPSKMEAARARKLFFQSANTEAASWCSRQSSALLLALESSASTT